MVGTGLAYRSPYVVGRRSLGITSLLFMSLLIPFADGSVVDTISGGAGWVGAGLLGAVLGWLLMIHLPAKDKQIKEMIDSRDKLSNDLMDKSMAADRERRTDFRDQLKTVTDHCKEEMSSLVAGMQKEIEQLAGAIVDLRRSFDVNSTMRAKGDRGERNA